MKLVRTFHPVGHGAFYTERFYDDHNVCKFTAVYDCGGGPVGGIKKYITNYVRDDSNLNENGRIDILFVSHFHSDHIEGIPHLLDYCDKIAFPVLTPNIMLEAVVHNAITQKESNKGEDVNDILYDIYDKKGIYDEKRMMFVDEAEEKRQLLDEDSSREIEYAGGVIKSGIKFTSNKVPNWIFYPYNLKKGEIKQKIKDYFKANGVITENNTIDTENLKIVLRRSLKEVQKIYKETEDEKTNFHSMTVYSGHKDCHRHLYCECCCVCKIANCDKCNNLDANPHCLYMGDFPANVQNVSELKRYYKEYWRCRGTIQVPHHGSNEVDGVYDDNLFYHCKIGIFSMKFRRYNGIPSSFVIKELINSDAIPVYVTDDIKTKVTKIYSI